ncbi:MAG: hypothetical protein INR64_15655 [Caulobacteraceae bacterium]|nr:hypothetical protein [Caulobacter sp.]
MQTSPLTIDDLLDEPIVRLMMAADRVDDADLRSLVARAAMARPGLLASVEPGPDPRRSAGASFRGGV